MTRYRLVCSWAFLQFLGSSAAVAQTLSSIRAVGPAEVIENTVTRYSVIATFGEALEYDVTLSATLWLDPGHLASIDRFGFLSAFDITGTSVETVHATYSFGKETRSATLDVMLSLDCNGNGVPDVRDIAMQASADCNANSVPDECDLEGISDDCNADSIPDECSVGDTHVQLSHAHHIRAYIDGRDQLVLRRDTVQWHHFSAGAPGRHPSGGGNQPTYLDGVAWTPAWPEPPPARIEYEAVSSSYSGLTPPLLAAPAQVQLIPLQARNPTAVAQQPSEANDFTLIIEFNDYSSGPAWYEISIVLDISVPADCNGNDQLDPCEWGDNPGLDCNRNGRLDGCDIVAGASADCDRNTQPDECAETALNSALLFDGLDDFVEIEESTGLAYTPGSSLTIEAYIKPLEGYPSQPALVVGQVSDGPARDPYGLRVNNGAIEFAVENALAARQVISAGISSGVWSHVAGVLDASSGELALYVDGRLKARSELSVTPESATVYPILLGGEPNAASRNYEGVLDEVRIWRAARTRCELRENMRRSLRGDEHGLVGYWSLDLCDTQIIFDSSTYQHDGILGFFADGAGEAADPLWTLSDVGVKLPPLDAPHWTPPAVLSEVSSGQDWSVSVTADERTMLLCSERDGFAQIDIYMATRGSIDAPFSPPTRVPEMSVLGYLNHDCYPELRIDGLKAYFSRFYEFDPSDLYVATRSSSSQPWSPATSIADLNTVESEARITVSSDELAMVFLAARNGQLGYRTASRATVEAAWTGFEVITSLAGFTPRSCDLSDDGLTLYVTAQGPTGLGGFDVWKLRRLARSEPFGTPIHIPELSSPKQEFDVSIVANGGTLYLARERGGNAGDIYRSTLVDPLGNLPASDLTCDGFVGAADFTEFVSCFVGPSAPSSDLECEAADIHFDGHVDLFDFAVFQRAYSGE